MVNQLSMCLKCNNLTCTIMLNSDVTKFPVIISICAAHSNTIVVRSFKFLK